MANESQDKYNNVCHDCNQDCEFNKTERLIDANFNKVWIKTGNKWEIYKDGVCMISLRDGDFYIQKLKFKQAWKEFKAELKEAFIKDILRLKRWLRIR